MPCMYEDPGPRPSPREIESTKVAQHILYVFEELGRSVPLYVSKIKFPHGNASKVDEMTDLLCSTIRGMTDQEQESIIYNGRVSKARKLADWWERHQLVDKKRKEAEKKNKKREAVKKKALAKLTKEEKEVLGLKG